jgi:4-hydroxy-tetrahydrodipicolinate reductase
MTRIGIVGAPGRLGGAVALEAARRGWSVTLRASRTGLSITEPPDVIVDASHPSAAVTTAAWCRVHGAALVQAVSGLPQDAVAALRDLAETVPVVLAPNLAAGHELQRVAAGAVAVALAALDEEWEAVVVDRHPRSKRDAPSGTARELRDACAAAGLRPPEIASLRCGLPVADHAVVFTGGSEQITIRHGVRDLRAAAHGAVRAAAWAARAAPGLWRMSDVWTAAGTDAPIPSRIQETRR